MFDVTRAADFPISLIETPRPVEVAHPNSRFMAVDLEADALHHFRPRLCYLQVATDDALEVIDVLKDEQLLRPYIPTLENEQCTKFFHAAQGDLSFLADHGIRVRNLFDTHRAATLLGWPKVGLADVVQQALGVALDKSHQQSDFSVRPPAPDVLAYMSNDVRYLCEVGRRVMAACREADVLEEVVLDCERLASEAEKRPSMGADFRPKIPKQGLSAGGRALALARVVSNRPYRKKDVAKFLSNARRWAGERFNFRNETPCLIIASLSYQVTSVSARDAPSRHRDHAEVGRPQSSCLMKVPSLPKFP